MNELENNQEPPGVRDLFPEWRSPRLGSANPSVLTNPVWQWLVHTGISAYRATELMGGPAALKAGPGWCFDRFGQTTTLLPDGREVLVAGEHEDYYDPDFFIYNDVVVKPPDGEVSIYGYPREVFPPTDFHTATLLPERIVLIGSLGYQGERLKSTQVLQLMLDDFAIHRVDAHGASPGWVHRHRAVLSEDGAAITVFGGMIDPGSDERSLKENIDDWVLDLRSWTWTRTTDRNWPQWTFRRADRHYNQLWRLRHAIWLRDVQWKDQFAQEVQLLEASIGRTPDLDLLPTLYRPDDSVTQLPHDEDPYNVFRILVDGIVVRFTEESHLIRGVAEGALSQERLQALQDSVRDKLAALERAAWETQTI